MQSVATASGGSVWLQEGRISLYAKGIPGDTEVHGNVNINTVQALREVRSKGKLE